MELFVFIIAGAISLVGALGLVTAKNPVHAALFMVMALFGIAVLFLAQDAQFLAAVQVIVYAGAIVVLFLFVIMLLGVDTAEDLDVEPIAGQRPLALLIGVATLALSVIFVAVITDGGATGVPSAVQERVDSVTLSPDVSATELLPDDQTLGAENKANIEQLGETIFTDYVFAFEITALLLTIAVVGAVVLARRPKADLEPIPDRYEYEGESA